MTSFSIQLIIHTLSLSVGESVFHRLDVRSCSISIKKNMEATFHHRASPTFKELSRGHFQTTNTVPKGLQDVRQQCLCFGHIKMYYVLSQLQAILRRDSNNILCVRMQQEVPFALPRRSSFPQTLFQVLMYLKFLGDLLYHYAHIMRASSRRSNQILLHRSLQPFFISMGLLRYR